MTYRRDTPRNGDGSSARAEASSAVSPSRAMPVSRCRITPAPVPAQSARSPGVFSTGVSAASPSAPRSAPGRKPLSTATIGPGPRAARTAIPSSSCATKKWRHPAAASTGATSAAPSP